MTDLLPNDLNFDMKTNELLERRYTWRDSRDFVVPSSEGASRPQQNDATRTLNRSESLFEASTNASGDPSGFGSLENHRQPGLSSI